jgi:hypothetical protein
MSLSLVDTGPVPLYVSNPGYKLKNNTTGKSITTRTEATQNGNFTIIEKGPLADTYRKAGIVDGGISGGLPGGDRVVYTYNAQNNTYTFNSKDGFRLSDYSGSSLDNINRNIKTSLYTTIPPNSALALSKLPGYQSVANSNQPRSPIVDPNVAEALEQATGVEQTPADQEGGLPLPLTANDVITTEIKGKREQKGGSFGDWRYPGGLTEQNQDVIKFTMREYIAPSGLQVSGDRFTGRIRKKEQKGTTLGTVTLPIQPTITDSNSVNWQQDSLNPIELAALDLAQATIESGTTGGKEAIARIIGTIQEDSDNIRKGLLSAFAGAAIGRNVLERTTGAILNPNIELLFNAPSLRVFNYRFQLSARDEPESKQIQKIIRFFKEGMAVRRSAAELFLVTPNIFEIKYLYKNNDHPYINRIKTCALTNCSVDYTPTGSYMTFPDGAMVSYAINLTFEELEPIYQDDYEKDGEIGF